MKKNKPKPFTWMNAEELAEATREFDRPLERDKFKPMSRSERARWDAARRGRGRPKLGKGTRPVQITIERGLLEQADRLAHEIGISRSQLIGSGLRLLVQVAQHKRRAS